MIVYVLFREALCEPLFYCGTFSSQESAETRMRVLKQEEECWVGYSSGYVIRPVRLDSGE